MRALERLERDEIVRSTAGSGDQGGDWQLDHDYLAQAVITEERRANRFNALLRDGAEAWRNAGTDLRQRVRTLLPLRTQLELAWARVRWRGRLDPAYCAFAAISTLRVLPLVLLLVIAGWVRSEWDLRTQGQEIVNGLGNGDKDPVSASAVLRLWSAPSSVRRISWMPCCRVRRARARRRYNLGQRVCLVGTGHCRSPGASPA